MKIADNLILCATPLQVLIAEKIIEKYPSESFSLIMITYSKNEKYLYYFNRLKKKCKTAKLLNINGKWSTLFYVVYFRLSMLDKNAKRVFLSNIDNIIFQTILSMLDKIEVYTFDDGTANLDKTSFFYRSESLSNKLRLIKKCLNISLDVEKIKGLSRKHYTIYNIPNVDNIIPSLEHINLLSLVHINRSKPKSKIKIVLGQPIFEHIKENDGKREELNIELTQKLIGYSEATLYFPHPRETYKIRGIDYIKTNLIFEDFIIEQLKNNIEYDVYTFFSSVGLNIINVPNVTIHYCRHKDVPSYWDNMYHLLNEIKIKIEDF